MQDPIAVNHDDIWYNSGKSLQLMHHIKQEVDFTECQEPRDVRCRHLDATITLVHNGERLRVEDDQRSACI